MQPIVARINALEPTLQALSDAELIPKSQDLKARLLRSETKVGLLEYEHANPPWYDTHVFYFVLGVVTVSGIGLLATQAF